VWSQDVRFSKLGVHENLCNIQKLWKQQQQLVETMKQASHHPSSTYTNHQKTLVMTKVAANSFQMQQVNNLLVDLHDKRRMMTTEISTTTSSAVHCALSSSSFHLVVSCMLSVGEGTRDSRLRV